MRIPHGRLWWCGPGPPLAGCEARSSSTSRTHGLAWQTKVFCVEVGQHGSSTTAPEDGVEQRSAVPVMYDPDWQVASDSWRVTV